MNPINQLEQIQQILKNAGLDCSIEPQTPISPFGRVLIFLGNDPLNRERILEITSQIQEMGDLNQDSQFLRVQFQCALPFDATDLAAADLMSLLMYLNRMIELPGFEFDQVHNKIYYRYVLITSHNEIQKPLLNGIVGTISLLLELFSETIERVAKEKNSFNDILEQMLEITDKIT